MTGAPWWLLLLQIVLVALVPIYTVWMQRRKDAADSRKSAAETDKIDADATEILSRAAGGLVDRLDARLRFVEGEAKALRETIVVLEDTVKQQAVLISNQAIIIREQAVTIKEQQCRIEALTLENARLRAGLDLLMQQALAMGQKPAFEK